MMAYRVDVRNVIAPVQAAPALPDACRLLGAGER
jgi:hypothetical protein